MEQDLFALDKNYSTTRLITKQKPVIANNFSSKYKNILFLPDDKSRKGEGGLRTHGYFKQNIIDKPLITVVTVVYDGEKYLEKTILSVINQTYNNVEYIIIDGGSTDGTVDLIKKYEDKIDYWISETDKGIYDAMNKGIDSALGKWINFMNADDRFYDRKVLEVIFHKNNFNDAVMIYGKHQVIYTNTNRKTRIAKPGKVSNLWKGSQFSHQSVFVLLSLHKGNKYNVLNKIGADFEFFYKMYRRGKNFYFVDVVISSITSGGISDISRAASIVSWWKVVEKNYKVNLHYILLIIKETLKIPIKKMLNK